MKTPYFYIIEHKTTQQYYAGCKINASANSSNFMTEKGYKTTSKIVRKIIENEGLEAFKIVKIKHFKSAQEAVWYETRFLQKVNAAQNPRFLNQQNGGKNFINKGGYKLKESTKNKMRKPKSEKTIKKQNEEKRNRPKSVYQKMVETRKKNGLPWHSDKMRERIKEFNQTYWDNEKREKHAELMREYYKKTPISEETRKKLKERSQGKNNKMYGKKHNEETRKKMRLAWQKRKKNQSFSEDDLF